ncbi:MAG: hypothetical protein KC464_07735, partial [Myxococcales bacterium]|nr:hypothetical protein [Myxococcales bacterium]
MASFKPRPGNDDDAVNAAARAEAARGEATSWAATQDARARTISAELDQADALDTADAAWQAAR